MRRKYDILSIINLLLKYDLKLSSIVYYEFCIGVYIVSRKYLKEIVDKYFGVVPLGILRDWRSMD